MTDTRHRGRRDQAARAALTPLVLSGNAVCWRCSKPIAPTDEWDAGHLQDLALGGKPDGARVPEHRRCNRSDGARLRWALPTRRRRASRLRSWLELVANRLRFLDRAALSVHTCALFLSPKIPYGDQIEPSHIPPSAYLEGSAA